MFLRLVLAVLGSSVSAVAVVFVLLLLTGEASGPMSRYILTNAAGFTLLGVLGFLVPLRFGLAIAKFDSMLSYVLPGFSVSAGTALIMGMTGRQQGFLSITVQALIVGGIGAVTALVFWRLAVGVKAV